MATPAATTTTTTTATTPPVVTPSPTTPPAKKRRVWNIVIGAIGALTILIVAICASFKGRNHTTPTPARTQVRAEAPDEQMSGNIVAVHGEWRGVTSFVYRIDMNILDNNVRWQVRFDEDDSRIQQLYPRNLRPGSHREQTNGFNTIEVSLPDDEPARQARVVWGKSKNVLRKSS